MSQGRGQFVTVNFNARPELVKEMSLFMLSERVVDSGEVKTQVANMKSDVTTAVTQADAAKADLVSVSKCLGDLIAAFNTYKTGKKGKQNQGEGNG
jgi:hypothetical protein